MRTNVRSEIDAKKVASYFKKSDKVITHSTKEGIYLSNGAFMLRFEELPAELTDYIKEPGVSYHMNRLKGETSLHEGGPDCEKLWNTLWTSEGGRTELKPTGYMYEKWDGAVYRLLDGKNEQGETVEMWVEKRILDLLDSDLSKLKYYHFITEGPNKPVFFLSSRGEKLGFSMPLYNRDKVTFKRVGED